MLTVTDILFITLDALWVIFIVVIFNKYIPIDMEKRLRKKKEKQCTQVKL